MSAPTQFELPKQSRLTAIYLTGYAYSGFLSKQNDLVQAEIEKALQVFYRRGVQPGAKVGLPTKRQARHG